MRRKRKAERETEAAIGKKGEVLVECVRRFNIFFSSSSSSVLLVVAYM